MPNVDVIVMVDKERRADLDQVAKSLEEKGLHVHEKMPRFRTITGTSDSSQLDELKTVEGVEVVRTQQNFQLPPMDEKIPQ